MINDIVDPYVEALRNLKLLIPLDEAQKILSQKDCEYDFQFMGFIDVYESLSRIVPKRAIIIDFGCYLAAQSYFFKNHAAYIGVDTEHMTRFQPKNATHYVGTIQEYIENELPELLKDTRIERIFAICSYVPDDEARELVRKTFPNVLCYYPG